MHGQWSTDPYDGNPITKLGALEVGLNLIPCMNKYKHVLGHGKLLVITEFLAIAGLVISEAFDLSLKISFPPGLAADASYKRVLGVRELVINGLYCITLCHTFLCGHFNSLGHSFEDVSIQIIDVTDSRGDIKTAAEDLNN